MLLKTGRRTGGCGKDLAFVIDVSGSMSSAIRAVQSSVRRVVSAIDPKSVHRYILTTFSDPQCGNTRTFTDIKAFLAAVGALRLSGGGDCPELMNCGILAALDKMEEGSECTRNRDKEFPPRGVMYVFSDASAKDESRWAEVNSRLRNAGNGIFIKFLLTGLAVLFLVLRAFSLPRAAPVVFSQASAKYSGCCLEGSAWRCKRIEVHVGGRFRCQGSRTSSGARGFRQWFGLPRTCGGARKCRW